MSTTANLPSRLLLAFVLMAIAGALRFYKLGDWPFAGDETATLAEEQSLFLHGDAPQDTQIYRLPRAIPLSHLFHHIGNSLAGLDEFGSRMMMAVLGTLSVGLVFLMLDALRGRVAAIATSLLVALWPEHILYSQQARFYIVAAFFAYLCILIGAFAAQRRSTLLCLLLGVSGFAAMLSHTLMGVLLPITFAGIFAAAVADRRPLPKNALLVFLGSVIAVGIFFQFYLRPLLSGWNTGATWGYGVLHSTLASVNMVGWPVVLLAALGFLVLLHERNGQNWYWITCTLGWAAAGVVFPLVVAHHPEYVFPLAISAVVLAGCAIAAVYEALRSRSLLIAVAWVGLACLGNLPSLASHYLDGSRPDMRTAAQYVKNHWQPGDRVTGFSVGLFCYYAPGCEPAIALPPTQAAPKLAELADGKGRLWVVVQSGRSGLPEDLRKWLGTRCSHELKVRRTRFDYADNCVDVFLYAPVGDKRNASPLAPDRRPQEPAK
jgi:hypothetical protein